MFQRILKLTPLDLPLALFLLSGLLGLWPAYDRSLGRNTLIALVVGFLLYLLVSRLAVSRRWWRAIAAVIVLASMLLSLYFVTQYARFDYPEKIEVLDRLGAFIGRIVPPIGEWAPTTNSVATFLEGTAFLAIALALTEKKRVWRAGWAIGVGLIGLALLMSASRGAWLAVAVALALWLSLHWQPARVAAIGGAIVALGLIVYVIVQGDITALEGIPIINRTLAPMFVRPDRLEVYRGSIYLIQDFPLTGIGLGEQFAMVYSRYALLIQHAFLSYSHNLYLEVWLEQGLLGITAWLWLMTALYQAARTHARPGADLLYQSTWIGLTAAFVHGISDACQYVSLWCWFPFFGLLGLNAAILLRRDSTLPRRRRLVVQVGVVGVFLVAVAVSLHPLPATWHANLGCILQARGDLIESLDDGKRAALYQQAAARYQRAIQIAPQDRTAQQRLGLILVNDGSFQEGVEHLEAAWRSDPENTTTRKGLGLAYVWVGELEKARSLLRGVPDIVYELNIWGWWRFTQGQTEQSLNAYRVSLLLEPNQPEIRERLEQIEATSSP